MGAPLAVDDEIVAAYRAAITGRQGPALLLGVTPQLADIVPDLTAVERNPSVIASRWPGDTPQRRALLADWREMHFAPAAFALCIGDGSLNAMDSLGSVAAMLARLTTFLASGARLALRVYLTPDTVESVAAVFAAARARQISSFSALKWRLAMAMVQEQGDPSIAVRDIFTRFADGVADRGAFALETGMDRESIDAIDIYRESAEIYCFPTAAELRAAMPGDLEVVSFASSGRYELAERCPILVLDRV